MNGYNKLNRLSTCTESLPGAGVADRITRYLYDMDGHTRYKQLPGGAMEERRQDSRGRRSFCKPIKVWTHIIKHRKESG